MKIYFDVHGTLLSTTDEELRPGTADLFQYLYEAGYKIILWSTAGSGYARDFARQFDLLPWVDEFYSKFDQNLKPDFCVDDHPNFLIGRMGNVQVKPYHGGRGDREMTKVREALSTLEATSSTEVGSDD